jgi:hypothetical protein
MLAVEEVLLLILRRHRAQAAKVVAEMAEMELKELPAILIPAEVAEVLVVME